MAKRLVHVAVLCSVLDPFSSLEPPMLVHIAWWQSTTVTGGDESAHCPSSIWVAQNSTTGETQAMHTVSNLFLFLVYRHMR